MNQNKPAAPLSDDKLRALLHDRLPQAPRNPWFVRKVMNRLPAKDSPAYSRIEYITYIIAIIAVIAGWWYAIAVCDMVAKQPAKHLEDYLSGDFTSLVITYFG